MDYFKGQTPLLGSSEAGTRIKSWVNRHGFYPPSTASINKYCFNSRRATQCDGSRGRAIKKQYLKKTVSSKKLIYTKDQKKSLHKELRLPVRTALAGLRDVNLDAQISWQAQHFEFRQLQISWQARHFVAGAAFFEVQI